MWVEIHATCGLVVYSHKLVNGEFMWARFFGIPFWNGSTTEKPSVVTMGFQDRSLPSPNSMMYYFAIFAEQHLHVCISTSDSSRDLAIELTVKDESRFPRWSLNHPHVSYCTSFVSSILSVYLLSFDVDALTFMSRKTTRKQRKAPSTLDVTASRDHCLQLSDLLETRDRLSFFLRGADVWRLELPWVLVLFFWGCFFSRNQGEWAESTIAIVCYTMFMFVRFFVGVTTQSQT